jgi:coatomer subunit beta'
MVRNTDVENMNLKMATTSELKDGEKVSAFVKELGSVEIYPQSIKFNSNGQLFAICGEDDYVIYTSRAFKNAGAIFKTIFISFLNLN